MVLKYKYHSEDGRLESYRNYTIAQNSGQTNSIVVTSTDPNAQDYKYCLEFVCYNRQNVPKTQYVSPVLEYSQDGLSFVIPEGLTQYRGHVDMQLIGYSPEDNALMFKSISKGAKAFDVEGSLNVMEQDVADTPNIFTEFFEELAFYRKTRDEIADTVKQDTEEQVALFNQEAARVRSELAQSIREELLNSAQGALANDFYKVIFRINGEIIKSVTVQEGKKLQEPTYSLPDGCEVVGGWYDMSKDKLWDFEEDSVSEDLTLTLNFMSTGIGIATNGKIKNFANLTGDIYLPDYYNGKKITNVDTTVTNLADNVNLHFGYNINNYLGVLNKGNQVKNMLFPADSKMRTRSNGIYTDKEQVGMVSYVFAPRNSATTELYIQSDCQQLAVYAIANMPNLKKIVIPPTVTGLNNNCITNTGITTLTIPSSVTYCNSAAVFNNANLESIYLECDLSDNLTSGTFIDASQTPSVRPTLYVRPDHYANYIKKNLQNYYTIKVIGKE
ncbi:MAG: leucine-rich repeat domain-containing protein, partial [Clostridia bacterium]|nr:leucine-rich repeat domain-containing protein [Clostridia bacterium]